MAGKKVNQISLFVDSQGRELPVFVGVDVHKSTYHVTFLRSDGLCGDYPAPASPEDLIKMVRQLGLNVAMVAYEAGPTGFGLARALEAARIPVTVVAPSRVPRAVAPGAKTDRLDCRQLADLAMRGMLRPIAVPNADQEAERGLGRLRSDLTESLRKIKQRIKSLLLCQGVAEPAGLGTWSAKGIKSLAELELPAAAGLTLASLVRQMTQLVEERKLVDRQLEEICRERKHAAVVQRLRAVPGVGLVVAAMFRLEIFSPERFHDGGELTSYLGLAPQVRQSGEGKVRGKLRPVGQTKLRSLLVEAAWVWKSADPWAETCYRRILERCGLAQKAITAVARRLAIVLWRLCLEDRPYRPAQA
jgi:transposase